jgi:hypothetical protein
MLGAIALIAVLSSMTACGGDFRRTTPINAGTSAGSYTFTVTGTGNPAVTPAPTTTFTLIVN